MFATELVNLDGAVDSPDEEVRCVEADSSRDKPEGEHHQQCVAKVEQGRGELGDLQLQTNNKVDVIVGNRYEGGLHGSCKAKTHSHSS